MSEPPRPAPDTKDWTWTIHEPCPQCGFDAGVLDHDEIADLTVDYAAVLADVARGPRGAERPAPDVWSPTEYACHVRDVCALFVGRLTRMLAEDDPVFENWDQDATAVAAEYWNQRPGLVVGQLTAAADVIASQFAARPRRPVGPARTPLERLGVHRRHVRALLPARPRAPRVGRPALTVRMITVAGRTAGSGRNLLSVDGVRLPPCDNKSGVEGEKTAGHDEGAAPCGTAPSCRYCG